MSKQIEIRVERANRNKVGTFDCLFGKTLDINDSLEFPYNKVEEVLRILFPHESTYIIFRS